MPPLSLRSLNRALLARQLLLGRERVEAVEAIERVAGLQAQVARPPFVGLWTRLHDFERARLLELVHGRQVVRGTMMRGTLHLVSAHDYLRFRPTIQPVLTGLLASVVARAEGVDLGRLVELAREMLDHQPRAFDEIRALLAEHHPAMNDRVLGGAVRMELPLVQVPSPDAAWGWDARAPFAVAESWLGARLRDGGPGAGTRELVLRYLAAFGPATHADASAWSGLRGLRALFDELRPELRVFRDERGRELFDLPDARRPDADVEAPVRFLPEFDNLILSHADRSRIIAPEHRARIATKNAQVPATFLVDGFVAGTWRVETTRGAATLAVRPFGRLAKNVRGELGQEGLALLRFVEPEASRYDVTFAKAE